MNLYEHCTHTHSTYGVAGKDIHKWMDAPVKIYGRSHRKVRHIADNPPHFAIEKYGFELAQNIIIDHILADKHEKKKDVSLSYDYDKTDFVRIFQLQNRTQFYELRRFKEEPVPWVMYPFIVIKVNKRRKNGGSLAFNYGKVVYNGTKNDDTWEEGWALWCLRIIEDEERVKTMSEYPGYVGEEDSMREETKNAD